RGSAKIAVMTTIERNEHLDDKSGASGTVLGHNLLYLACTTPQGMGAEALQRAKEGGHVIFYQITRTGNGPLGGSHFRLMLDPPPGVLSMSREAQERAFKGKWWTDGRH